MTDRTNGDSMTNGHHSPQGDQEAASVEAGIISSYLCEALKPTLGVTQDEIQGEGGPLAPAQAESTIETFQTFLLGSRAAIYAQKLETLTENSGTLAPMDHAV